MIDSKYRRFCISKDSFGNICIQNLGDDFKVDEAFEVIEVAALDEPCNKVCKNMVDYICNELTCKALTKERDEYRAALEKVGKKVSFIVKSGRVPSADIELATVVVDVSEALSKHKGGEK